MSQHFSLSREVKNAAVFALHIYTLTPAGWIIVCVWERCAAEESDRTILQYSQLGGECCAGADTHTHTFLPTEDGHRCASGRETGTLLAGTGNLLRYLGNLNLICSRSCVCVRLRRFVCLFCVKDRESKCSQTCLSRAQTAREQSSSSCRFVMLRRNLATLNTGFGMRLDAGSKSNCSFN